MNGHRIQARKSLGKSILLRWEIKIKMAVREVDVKIRGVRW
jgi:hypothetical protein